MALVKWCRWFLRQDVDDLALPQSMPPVEEPFPTYDRDGLRTVHDHSFLSEPSFRKAYDRGVRAAGDYGWQWRVHIGLWAAKTASRLAGDFVECGVNRGFLASAVMEYLDWDSLGKQFYLLDTFSGLDDRYLTSEDRMGGALEKNRHSIETGFYVQDIESVVSNFSQWTNVRIIQGPVPETLGQVVAEKIAFLHLDMNCAFPEVAAVDRLWNRLVSGALILLDDYAYFGYGVQKAAMDKAMKGKGVSIVSLPTGQGLIIRPPEGPTG
ncbi:MAG TPA: class I SAM-dependent methyltransferase [Nitrospira sp.]|nr:class I SAM-dependent methyltransferase [Nitrospira sp.]